MSEKKKVPMTLKVDDYSLNRIVGVAKELEISLSEALDFIVSKWAEYLTDAHAVQEDSQEQLDLIKKRRSRLEQMMSDYSFGTRQLLDHYYPEPSIPESE
ncbi:MAG: hypothetical protein QNJ72_26180 [Pleurocapsa sp. MO_226.B13]|nr:hypothetical protein [Pleurocapsa sp. MO_226.B13]